MLWLVRSSEPHEPDTRHARRYPDAYAYVIPLQSYPRAGDSDRRPTPDPARGSPYVAAERDFKGFKGVSLFE